ncbi:hypothetical protein BKA63DRAFT_168021 [Paraphoma chrysanthemicola]|nr:hypothetical protein BKA63DRAFT_168021 [Paraphoma chrysanthemicola]
MPTPALIAALSLAAVFSTALVWLAFYYVYRYIHLRCLELDHWFHVITPPAWRRECRHCEGTGRVVKVEVGERHHGKKRGRSRRRSRSKSKNRGVEYGGEGNGGGMRGGNGGREEIGMQMTQRALPAAGYPQGRDGQEQYDPWNGYQGHGQVAPQMGASYPSPIGYPAPFPQTYQQPYQKAYPQVPQQPQQTPPLVTPYPAAESVSSTRPYAKHTRKTSTARSMQSQPVSAAKSRPTQSRKTREQKVDYIDIVEDYPPIVKDSLKKKRPVSPLSSSSSSSSSESAEEVPRKSIPQAKPRFEMPFQSPQYPPWGVPAPTDFPWQWSGNEGKAGGRNSNARQ